MVPSSLGVKFLGQRVEHSLGLVNAVDIQRNRAAAHDLSRAVGRSGVVSEAMIIWSPTFRQVWMNQKMMLFGHMLGGGRFAERHYGFELSLHAFARKS